MSLTPRQVRCYKHTVDLWEPSRTVSPTTGAPSADTYELAYSGVVAHFPYTKNMSQTEAAGGRTKRPTLLTTDELHMDATQEINDAWIIINRTLKPDGSQSSLYNKGSRVEGGPQVIESSSYRTPNYLTVYCNSLEKLPATINTYYGL